MLSARGRRRREFVLGFAGAAALAVAARGQQAAVPVVGMLSGQSADGYSHLAESVRLGLKDEGFVDGQNVAMEYRWAAGRDEQLPAMAVELVNRPVAVLLTGGSIWSTISAKAATATIPIVFTTASDPVRLGFVASLNRPGGNVTGVSFLGAPRIARSVTAYKLNRHNSQSRRRASDLDARTVRFPPADPAAEYRHRDGPFSQMPTRSH